ncbi:class I SAM-dependent methyltransferase [Paraburkholderia sediminicola]|uniref:class I SAM-dependent methyltransferase n=1 Tax=Paraburkholderia sediminicola TaxID=458836 RepID=UPI0038BC51C0
MTHGQPSTVNEKPQNIYDDPVFFEGYKTLLQNDTGLNGALERPSLRQLLPGLSGLHILDLGCGFGDFARFARDNGATSVMGVDVSARMLQEAEKYTRDLVVTYLNMPLEQYQAAPQSIDLIVSSLALHYVDDYADVVKRLYQGLKPGGRLIFSVEHPMCTANPVGWVSDEYGSEQYWPVDNYQQEGRRETRWFIDGVVKYHRTVETYVNTLLRAGFLLHHLGEPTPTNEAMTIRPELRIHCRRPPFLFLMAMRPGV